MNDKNEARAEIDEYDMATDVTAHAKIDAHIKLCEQLRVLELDTRRQIIDKMDGGFRRNEEKHDDLKRYVVKVAEASVEGDKTLKDHFDGRHDQLKDRIFRATIIALATLVTGLVSLSGMLLWEMLLL